jgi:E-phenylitaconyl-CoA hydratase
MTLRYEKSDGIGRFTIDNGKVNVFTPMMHKALYFALKEFEIDPDVRVGIITGADGRSFSAGADLKKSYRPPRTRQQELEATLFLHQNEGAEPSRPGWDVDVMRLRRYKPIVAAVSKYCLGQGIVYMMLHSDIRIAADDAVFGLPEIAYGFAGLTATTQLARHIPYIEAAYLSLTGDSIDAHEAYRIHLVNRDEPAADLMATAESVAKKIAQHPPTAVRVEMEALQMGMDLSRTDAQQHGHNLSRMHRFGYEGPGIEAGFYRSRKE